MANLGNPAQGYTAPPGQKVDQYGYVESSPQYQQETQAMKNADSNPNPSGGGFIGGDGNSMPLTATNQGTQLGTATAQNAQGSQGSQGLQAPSQPNPPEGNQTYKVQAGDNPTTIAAKFGVPLSAVTGYTDPKKLQIGQNLNINNSKYQQGLQALQGKPAPQTAAEGLAAAGQALPASPGTSKAPPSTPNVDNFFQTNPGVAQSTQDLMNFLSPQTTKDEITKAMTALTGDKATLTAEKAQLMNIQNIMSGTAEDIRSEVTAANGFATDSQVQALAVGRNKTLLKQATLLQDQIQTQQDLIANDTSMLNFEKDMANTQFTQRMGILNYQQANQKNMQTASKDSLDTLTKALGWDGLYAAYKNDPQQMAHLSEISGMSTGAIAQAAVEASRQRNLDNAYKQAQTAKLYQDINATSSDKTQQKLEQDYRQVLVKEVSSRSGTLGTEDSKVAQANHLNSLLQQYYDPKTGNYNVPTMQYGELVLGLASLVSKTGTPTDSQVDTINQKTAKGDLAGAISYITGTAQTGSSQELIQNLKDSIDRQANTAVQNREAALNVLRGLAPTDLESSRKQALEKNTLVPYSGDTQPQTMTLNGKTYTKGADGKYY